VRIRLADWPLIPASAELSAELSVPLDYTHTSAGTIESLRIPLSPESVPNLHAARVQISWDERRVFDQAMARQHTEL
jgi:hypothetical protein